jgi:hypothetical protein
MTRSQLNKRKAEIEKIFANYRSHNNKIVSHSITRGKIYEAHILSSILESLKTKEKFYIVLKNGNNIKLKSSPGPINRKYPRFDIYKSIKEYINDPNDTIAEIWTDIEFSTLSYSFKKISISPNRGEYHELDILVVEPNIPTGTRPNPNQIFLGVECKNTNYKKSFLREILGVRRELSFLSKMKKTKFNNWPQSQLKADPPSCLQVYCIDPKINNYKDSGDVYSIEFIHSEL